jgi:hypothetical protein
MTVGNALKYLAFNVIHVLYNALDLPKCIFLDHLNIKFDYLSQYKMEEASYKVRKGQGN